MDFRMRSLKDSKTNYNSMVEFPRPDLSPYRNSPQDASRLRQLEVNLANAVDSFRR